MPLLPTPSMAHPRATHGDTREALACAAAAITNNIHQRRFCMESVTQQRQNCTPAPMKCACTGDAPTDLFICNAGGRGGTQERHRAPMRKQARWRQEGYCHALPQELRNTKKQRCVLASLAAYRRRRGSLRAPWAVRRKASEKPIINMMCFQLRGPSRQHVGAGSRAS